MERLQLKYIKRFAIISNPHSQDSWALQSRVYHLVLDQKGNFDTHLTSIQSIVMELENSSVMTNLCLAILSSMPKCMETLYGDLEVLMIPPATTTVIQFLVASSWRMEDLGRVSMAIFFSVGIQVFWYLMEDRILSLAASTFKDVPITISGKVPLIHSWYRARSHPSELAAGFYNTDNRAGYKSIAEIFSRNSCNMILPGMDQSDDHQSAASLSSPEMLFKQITSSCRDHGVKISGQNLSALGDSSGFEQIKKVLLDENVAADLFTYQRMGAYFFSPEHFPLFAQFTRCLKQPIQSLDDLPAEGDETAKSLHGTNLKMQVA